MVDEVRIGILTFHMAHNYGAMLQAYALCRSVSKIGDCECEIIDYRLPEIYDKYRRMLALDNIEAKRIKFEAFMNTLLPLSMEIEDPSDVLSYDLYIIGSDQVWNSKITRGLKDIYFAQNFPEKAICISYAASTGEFIDNWKGFFMRLSNFSMLSVREGWLKEVIEKNTTHKVEWSLDPVFLLSNSDWINLAIPSDIESEYILIYSFEMKDSDYERILFESHQGNRKIVELVTHVREIRKNIQYKTDDGPLEFLGRFAQADCVFTDSYHGVVFSIIFDKPFYYIPYMNGSDLRTIDLLNRIALKKDEKGFYRTDKTVKQLIEKYRRESLTYLYNAIKKG